MNILRVFPKYFKNFTPNDEMKLISHPALKECDDQIEWKETRPLPPHDEIHISCTFTWKIDLCERLRQLYQKDTQMPVRVGGVAYNSPCDTLTPGMYVTKGITFTSRGCNNNCSWCSVPQREGKIRELPITEGNIIQDNNFLQTSIAHKDLVFKMLKSQTGICFKGGLQANLIDEHFIENIQQLSISELWLACDTDDAFRSFEIACNKLKNVGYTRSHIRCYALIGDDMDANEERLQMIYKAGAMPFAQLYQPATGEFIKYSKDWKDFCSQWCRPASVNMHMKHRTDFREYR